MAQKTRLPGLSCGVVCVILRLAVLVELRLVTNTDTQTDRHRPMASTADAQHSAVKTRSSAIAEGPRDASCELKSYQLPRNSAETTYTTSPDQMDGMKLEI